MSAKLRFIVPVGLLVAALSGLVLIAPAAAKGCPLAQQTAALPPEPHVASWSRYWYRSEDGELWASGWTWFADGWKVGWRKPSGSKLEVTGKRLDGVAPPLEASISDGYGGTFQASGLTFATAGCWEVTAKAADSTLTFVVDVYPKAYKLDTPRNCEDLNWVIKNSDVILVGQVEGTYNDLRSDYLWRTVRTVENWRGGIGNGTRLDILQDARFDPLMEDGKTYLLFLWSQPGYHLQALCPTVGEVVKGQITLRDDLAETWSGWPLSPGQSLDELREQVNAIALKEAKGA